MSEELVHFISLNMQMKGLEFIVEIAIIVAIFVGMGIYHWIKNRKYRR